MQVIAFVDDEKDILDGLRRMLRNHRKEWDMHFYASPQDLLQALPEKKFDIIISDMRMPKMTGCELLQKVRKLSPGTLRIVLSGYAHDEMILESVHATHQFISKPAASDKITNAIESCIHLQQSLSDEAIKSLLGSIESLPSLPQIYDELMQEIASDDASIEKIGKIISQDLGLSSVLLKMVNSAFFGLANHIESPIQAVSILGMEAVKNLALSSSVFSSFPAQGKALEEMHQLNQFSQKLGMLAEKIASRSGLPARAKDHAQIAGMMSNLGELVAITYQQEIEKSGQSELDLALIGSYLLGIWAMPFPVVEAVRCHRNPALSKLDQLTPLTVVHAAWAMLTDYAQNNQVTLESEMLDTDYLVKIIGNDVLNEWKNIVENFCQKSESC